MKVKIKSWNTVAEWVKYKNLLLLKSQIYNYKIINKIKNLSVLGYLK